MSKDSFRRAQFMNLDDLELIKGIRVKNGSVKIYKQTDGKYLVSIKRYFLKIKTFDKKIIVPTFEEAEDYLASAKFDKLITKEILNFK